MTNKTVKPAEDLHPDYDIGFDEGRTCGYEEACDAFANGRVAHDIINALRKAGGKHGEGATMHAPQDWQVILDALLEVKAHLLHPESFGTGVDPVGNPE